MAIPDTAALVDLDFLNKASAVFDAAPPDSLTTTQVHDHDPLKLAEDLYQVFVSFQNSSGQFALVDSEYSGSWKAGWDPLATKYGVLLQRAKSAAQDGANYIDDFNINVADQFSPGESDVSGDVQRLKDWLDAHTGDDQLTLETQQISQAFLDLSDEVTAMCASFSNFASEKESIYDGDLAELNADMQSLQARITWEQSAASDAQRALDGLIGGLAMIASFFETLFTFGLSHRLMDEALDLLQRHARAEQDLRRRKDQVAAQAAALAKEKSQLLYVRSTLSVLAQDVIDVSGRVGRMANMWATAHSNFKELRTLLDGTTTVHSAIFFRRKVKVVGSTAAVFSADMKLFVNAVDKIANAQELVAYVISPQFGGSDATRGSLFNDARTLELDPLRPILDVEIISGWVIDGIRVTYRLRNGETYKVGHGTIEDRGGPVLTLGDDEYICGAVGKSGHANNGEPWMGDCVQQLQLTIKNSTNGTKWTYGPFGTARGLADSATTPISWHGRLLAFAGRADDSALQVGMRGISFAERFTGVINVLNGYFGSSQFGGSDTSRGTAFNDSSFDLDPQRPIINVTIISGWVIDGLIVTYRLKNGETQTVNHGTVEDRGGETLTLYDDEYIYSISGKSGHADNGEPWMGDCVQQLALHVKNPATGEQRTYGPFGEARGLAESATTIISWAGYLHSFAGRADDSAAQVGLHGISFIQKN